MTPQAWSWRVGATSAGIRLCTGEAAPPLGAALCGGSCIALLPCGSQLRSKGVRKTMGWLWGTNGTGRGRIVIDERPGILQGEPEARPDFEPQTYERAGRAPRRTICEDIRKSRHPWPGCRQALLDVRLPLE